ncbi:MAG: DUF4390 domain-containing protein [Steroidobacteraceae bacterium]
MLRSLLLLLVALAPPPPVRSAPLDGVLEVRSAYINFENGVFALNARIQYPLNDEIRGALLDGVALTFDLEVSITRARRFWWNADVTAVALRRELSYHVVSDRYVVLDVSNGQPQNFSALEDALAYIGTVEAWPVIVEPQLARDRDYEIAVRAGVRRGRMPDPLRSLIFWSDSWHRTSEWYAWSLPR